jgi:predicted RNA methylase
VNRSTKKRMHPGLAAHFPADTIHDKVARVLCETHSIPRKEFYESWSFVSRARRHLDAPVVWDLCAGHGLVALLFALLEPSLESVRAVDQQQPSSFEKMRQGLMAIDPVRIAKVTFDVLRLDALEPPPGRVFVTAVHACGRRTDRALDLALASRSSVAVLPCCHDTTSVSIPPAVLQRFSKRDAVDLSRMFRLHAAGYRTIARRVDDESTQCADAIIGIAPP